MRTNSIAPGSVAAGCTASGLHLVHGHGVGMEGTPQPGAIDKAAARSKRPVCASNTNDVPLELFGCTGISCAPARTTTITSPMHSHQFQRLFSLSRLVRFRKQMQFSPRSYGRSAPHRHSVQIYTPKPPSREPSNTGGWARAGSKAVPWCQSRRQTCSAKPPQSPEYVDRTAMMARRMMLLAASVTASSS